MKKINLNVVTRRGATGPLGASIGELSLALGLGRRPGGRGLGYRSFFCGQRLALRRGGICGFPGCAAGLGNGRLPRGRRRERAAGGLSAALRVASGLGNGSKRGRRGSRAGPKHVPIAIL